MDRGQKKSARGFARLQKLFHRRYDELGVYRCETGTAEVPIYFLGIDDVARTHPDDSTLPSASVGDRSHNET
jgi:hypothetical protein